MVFIVLLISSSIKLSFANICEASTNSEYIIKSDATTEVYDSDMNYLGQSVVVTDSSYKNLPGSTWIWISKIPNVDQIFNFIESFNLNSLPWSGTLKVIVDDSVSVYVNDKYVFREHTFNIIKICEIQDYLNIGINNVRFQANNAIYGAGIVYQISLVFN